MKKGFFSLCFAFVFFGMVPLSSTPENQSEDQAVKLSDQTEECLECHRTISPGIVEDWLSGSHAHMTPAGALKKAELGLKVSSKAVPEGLLNVAVGCYECHAAGSPILEGQVTALGPAPDESPRTEDMYEFTGYDRQKMDAWNASFRGRTLFKYFGFAATGVVGLVLLSYLMAAVNGLTGIFRRSRD